MADSIPRYERRSGNRLIEQLDTVLHVQRNLPQA